MNERPEHKQRMDPANAVLGLVLLDASKFLPIARERIGADDFMRPEHRAIWRGIESVATSGLPVDYGSVWRAMQFDAEPAIRATAATAIMDLLDPEQHDPVEWFEGGSPIGADDFARWVDRLKDLRRRLDRMRETA